MKKWFVVAFLIGLTAELYLQIPGMGVLAMLDIACYVISPLILLTNWSKMGKYMRRSIYLAFGWMFAAIVAGRTSDATMHDVLKETVVCRSSWAIMTVAWFVLRQDGRLYLVYLIGAALSSYVGLYYFKGGFWLATELKNEGEEIINLLVDKQRFPIMANLFFYGVVLTLFLKFKKLPSFIVIVGCVWCAFFLLLNGGSRSHFGFYMLAGLTGFVTMYGKSFAQRLLKNKILLLILVAVVVGAVFGAYKYMALSGRLGKSEMNKYHEQFEEADLAHSGLLGRAGFENTVKQFRARPWGNGPNYGKHSVFTSAVAREGVLGIVFWSFFYVEVFWFLGNRLVPSGRFAAFLALMIGNASWACLGSPFGFRHTFFLLMAFIALCRDNRLYGAGTVFQLRLPPGMRGDMPPPGMLPGYPPCGYDAGRWQF